MAELLQTDDRVSLGKRNSRRLRKAGRVPAVLYGHGEEVKHLSLHTEEVAAALRHGSTLLELTGSVRDNAIVQELHWDTFGVEVLHVDLMRVKSGERINVTIAVETRGEAAGLKEGGVVTQQTHEVEVEAPVTGIPDKLHVNINVLEVDQSLTAADIEDLPDNCTLLTEPETVIVICTVPTEEEEEQAPADSVEPEVIGRKADEDEQGGDS